MISNTMSLSGDHWNLVGSSLSTSVRRSAAEIWSLYQHLPLKERATFLGYILSPSTDEVRCAEPIDAEHLISSGMLDLRTRFDVVARVLDTGGAEDDGGWTVMLGAPDPQYVPANWVESLNRIDPVDGATFTWEWDED